MQMPYSQYCRIEQAAGGIGCTARAFVRAAHSKLKKHARGRLYRDQRHAWLRDGLRHLEEARHDARRMRI
jgi:hypothetical protein